MKKIFTLLFLLSLQASALELKVLINNKSVDTSSYKLKAGDEIQLICTNDHHFYYENRPTSLLASIGDGNDNSTVYQQGKSNKKAVATREVESYECNSLRKISVNCAIFGGQMDVVTQDSANIKMADSAECIGNKTVSKPKSSSNPLGGIKSWFKKFTSGTNN